MVSCWSTTGRTTRLRQNSGNLALAAGQKYDIRLEFYERGGLATARLSWAYPGQALQVVPQSVLVSGASRESTSDGRCWS